MYNPIVYKLKSLNENIDINNNIVLSESINQPLISLGFQYYLHRTKLTFYSTIKNIESKVKFYYVLNPFEREISNYENSLDNSSKSYLKTDINNRNHYKYWDILYSFDLINDKNIDCSIYSHKPDNISDTILNYKNKLINNKSDIKFNNVIINQEYDNNFVKQFIEEKGEIKKNEYKTIYNNSKLYKNKNVKSDLIIADGYLKINNYEEQYSYQLLLGEIINALNSQKTNGNLILKIFETYTKPTIKLIYLLNHLYEEVYIYKPYMSRITNSEKFLICKNFKKINNLSKIIENLEHILNKSNNDKYIFDFITNINISKEYLINFININTNISNLQQIMMNEIIIYIRENNYFGDKFHKLKELQIESTLWWIVLFYPPSNNLFKENLNKIQEKFKEIIEKNEINKNNISKLLI
jgi:23S rRNA U2552 (ribose-2'-O)-methylase RlmE/FtsJ